jgi:hypothetical protein
LLLVVVNEIVLFVLFFFAAIGKGNHYQENDPVAVLANKVGPYANPSESYEYYDLPFCPANKEAEHQHHSLGEDLSGDHKVKSNYKLYFLADLKFSELCQIDLDKKQQEQFIHAIKNNYIFEMFLGKGSKN